MGWRAVFGNLDDCEWHDPDHDSLKIGEEIEVVACHSMLPGSTIREEIGHLRWRTRLKEPSWRAVFGVA